MFQLIWFCCLVGSNPLEVPPLLTPGPFAEPEPQLVDPNRQRGPLGPAIPSAWRGQHLVRLQLNLSGYDLSRVQTAIHHHPQRQAWLTWKIRLDNSPTIIESHPLTDLPLQPITIGTFSSGRLAVRVEIKTEATIWLSAVTAVELCGPAEIIVPLRLQRPVNHLYLVIGDLPSLSPNGQLRLQTIFRQLDPTFTDTAELVSFQLTTDRTLALAQYDNLGEGRWIAQLRLIDETGRALAACITVFTITDRDTHVIVNWGYKGSLVASDTGSAPVFFC